MELGGRQWTAAFRGSREIGFTILSMTISLVSVFIPVLFMGGNIVGRLLHEFSVTIAVAILVSGFISLTLTPMLASRFLRLNHNTRHSFLYNGLERFFQGLTHAYERSLLVVLRHRLATLVVLFALLGGTVWLFFDMPKGFLPSTDSGVLNGIAVAGQDISFDSMVDHVWSVKDILEHDPNVRGAFANVSGGNQGQLYMMLKPREQRSLSADQVLKELQPKILSVPGIQAFLQNPPPITIGSNNTQSPYQLTLQGADQHEIYQWVPILMDRIRTLRGFMNVTSDLQIASPQVTLDINRDRAQTLGVTPDQIQNALFTAYGTRQVSTIYTPSNEYQVILEVEPQYQRNPDALSKLYVRSAKGTLVPLDTVVSVQRTVGPLSVNHFGQLPAATISFNLQPGFALGDAATAIDEVIAELRIPPTIAPLYQGTVQAFQQSFRGLSILLIVAILVIYMVLGMLYESFIHPITILSGLPSACIRRAIDPQDFSPGVGSLRIRWSHHAFRSGEEERDHDDRLRHRSAARGRPAGIRRHRSGLYLALPAYHDDHACRAIWYLSDCPGNWLWRRRAAAARPGGGGWPAVLTIHHVVHYTGGLPLFGSIGAEIRNHSYLEPPEAANRCARPRG